MNKTKTTLLLVLIVALGFFLRIYQIDSAPPGVYPDEAVNGSDALNALSGDWRWFYPDNQGREGLMMNLVAIFFKLFGVSVLSLKLPSILFGTLTIWGVYLLAKELFSNTRLALIASFLTAVSFWAINFSRISFRANMLPAILAFSFYFLWKGLRTKKWTAFATGGLIFGLGLHTYISFRIAPAILIGMFVVLLLSRRGFWREQWKNVLVFALGAFLTAAPMLYTFFITHPEYLESRSSSISVFSSPNPTEALLKSFSLSLLKYNFWGDQNWRHNFPPHALLDPMTGAFFLFGFFYAFFKFFRFLHLRVFRRIHDEKLEIFSFLLLSFFLMLAPEFLTAEGNPHALRAIGTQPFVFILAAFGFNYFFEYSQRHQPIFRKIIFGLSFLILLSIGFFNTFKYHLVWAKKIQTAQSFEKNLMDIVRFLPNLNAKTEKFILAENMQRIPIRVFSQNIQNINFVYFGQAEYASPKDKNNFIVIATHRNDEVFSKLEKKFPSLSWEEKKDDFGLSFWVMQ